jgi:hypothetical protein
VALARAGAPGELVALAAGLAVDLRTRLGLAAPTVEENRELTSALPQSGDAARLYAEARQRLFDYDCAAARDLAEKAVAADERFEQAHAALAQAWDCLGYEQRARDEAARALDLAAALPRRERLLAEARYRKLNHEIDSAVEIYRMLWEPTPTTSTSASSSPGSTRKAT